MTARAVQLDLGPRLERAAAEVADLKVELQLALERRNSLIVQAVDEGMTYTAIARAAGNPHPLTKAHISRLVRETEGDVEAALQRAVG